jgi:hypothetical protein
MRRWWVGGRWLLSVRWALRGGGGGVWWLVVNGCGGWTSGWVDDGSWWWRVHVVGGRMSGCMVVTSLKPTCHQH